MISSYRYLAFFIVSFFLNSFSAKKISPNNKRNFTFDLFPNIGIDLNNNKAFVVAGDNITSTLNSDLAYTISYCDLLKNNYFIPINTPSAIVNNARIENPLYSTTFANFTMFSSYVIIGNNIIQKKSPLLVPNNSSGLNNKAYILTDYIPGFVDYIKLSATDALTSFSNNDAYIFSITPSGHNNFSLITTAEGKNFNDLDSDSALYLFKGIQNFNSNAGSLSLSINQISKTSYDSNLNALKIGASNITLENKVFMADSKEISGCYIGLTGSGTTGFRAVTNNQYEIVSESACIGANKIISTDTTSNISILGLDVINTSTGLAYLAVLGGVGNTINVNNQVYALPLVNLPSTSLGKLANINQDPKISFSSTFPYKYNGNFFTEEATLPSHLYDGGSTGTLNAKVGKGPLKNFVIKSISSWRDTVFANAEYTGVDHLGVSGMFYSQAIFTKTGKIFCWTPWQRKNLLGNIFTESYQANSATNIFIYNSDKNSVYTTQWTNQGPWSAEYANIYKTLPCGQSGIQGITDIPFQHPALLDTIGNRPSFAIYTGLNTIIIQQTAKNDADFVYPNNGFQIFSDGSLSSFDFKKNIQNLIFTGGEISDTGPLITSALAYDNNFSWFVVGGSNGVYILCREDGTGAVNLSDSFSGLTSNMSWIKLGNFKKVKRVISNLNYIYVVSEKLIARIPINQNNISLGENCDYTVLAESNQIGINSSFSDGIFSENACLVATNVGLFVNGANTSIKTASDSEDLSWTKIDLPESDNIPPTKIFAISTTGYNDDWAVGDSTVISGNIYLMATSVSEGESLIYRFVSSGSSLGMKTNTISILPNYFVGAPSRSSPTINGIKSYYVNPELKAASLSGDGAAWFINIFLANGLNFTSSIFVLNPFLKNGYTFGDQKRCTSANSVESLGSYMGPVQYVSGLGLWTACSTFGAIGLW